MDLERESLREQATASSADNVNWAAAFESPEFCAGLQNAVAAAFEKCSRPVVANAEPEVAALEQLGEVHPTAMATAVSASGTTEGMLTAPTFIDISGSSLTQSSAIEQNSGCKVSEFVSTLPVASVGAISGLTQAFILGPGRPPIPAKLVSQILALKFVEMFDILPENLETPTSAVSSFTIEGSSIVPSTTTSSRKKTDIGDILTWVECFNGYVAVITASRPERTRDLLAYMALIIRLAKQFPGRCWYNYDRAFRLNAAAPNSTNWSKIHADLYHYHTSVAAIPIQPQVSRYREPRGDQNSMVSCKSWNSGACSSPRQFCRFRHKCDRSGCGGTHRRIDCQEFARKRGRSPDVVEPGRRRQARRE